MTKTPSADQLGMPTVNLSTGTVNFRHMFDLPSGKNGFKPSLGLRYSSSVDNSLAGICFSLEGLHSLRKLPNNQIFSSIHGLLVKEGDRMVPVFGGQAVTFKERLDSILVQYGSGKQEILSKANQPGFYTLTSLKSSDGEEAKFSYNPNDVLTQIQYSVYTILLVYSQRPDPFIQSHDSRANRLDARLSKIELKTSYTGDAKLLRSWTLGYDDALGRSFLKTITETGHRPGEADVSNPPVTLHWHNEAFATDLSDVAHQIPADADLIPVQWYGKGRTDLLVSENGQISVNPSEGGAGFGAAVAVDNAPAELGLEPEATVFGDVNGRGIRDFLVLTQGSKGVYAFTPGEGFGDFTPWAQFPFEQLDANSQFLDLNADGMIDFITADPLRGEFRLYLNSATGWSATPIIKPMGQHDINLETNGFIARVTGSIYQDLVKVLGGQLMVAAGKGPADWTDWEAINLPLPAGLNDLTPEMLRFADLTNTGADDILLQTAGTLYVWVNHGAGQFAQPLEIQIPDMAEDDLILFDDFIGAGHTQALIRCAIDQSFKRLSLLPTATNNLLKSVDNGSGLSSTLTYENTATLLEGSAGSYLPTARIVATGRKQVDAVSGGVWDDRYAYAAPFVTYSPQYVFSFGHVTSINGGDDSVAAKQVDFDYITPAFNAVLSTKDVSLIGAIKKMTISAYDAATNTKGAALSETNYTWKASTIGQSVARRMVENTRNQLDANEQPFATSTIEIEAYDDAGNIRRVVTKQSGTDFDGSPFLQSSTTQIDFAASANDKMLDRPMLVEKRDQSGSLLSASAYIYDDQPFGVLGSAGLVTEKYTYAYSDTQVQKYFNHLSPEEVQALGYVRLGGQPGLWRRDAKIHTRDTLKTIINALGYANEVTYDDHGLFETRVMDAMQATVSHTPDPMALKPEVTTAANGQQKTFTFDALGRIKTTTFPTAQAPVETFEYAGGGKDTVTTHKLLNHSGDYFARINHLSGAGEDSKTVLKGGDVSLTVQHTKAGARGLAVEEGGSVNGMTEAVFTHTKFDALDRPVFLKKPNGQTMQYAYDGATITVSEIINGVAEVKQSIFQLPNGEIGKVTLPDPSVMPITHRYDDQGQLVLTRSLDTPVKEVEYDAIGRQIACLDPDHGLRVLIHDALDNLVETRRHIETVEAPETLADFHQTPTTSALKETFNASSQRIESSVMADNAESTKFRYGENGFSGANLPTSVTSPAGKISYTYTDDNRIASQVMEDAVGHNRLGLDFDHLPNGFLDGLTYIDHKKNVRRHIRYEYDKLGRITAIPGHVKKITYDDKGMVSAIEHKNGVVTKTSWAADNASMTELSLTDSEANTLFKEAYNYDDTGRLIKVSGADSITDYKRDRLSRLVETKAGASQSAYAYTGSNYPEEMPKISVEFENGRPARLINKETNAAQACHYDTYGRLSKKGDTAFSYNGINQLQTVESALSSVDYRYDHQAQPALVFNQDGSLRRYAPDPRIFATDQGVFGCLMLGNQVIAIFDLETGASFGVHVNRHGDVVLISDPNGKPSYSKSYSPYGETSITGGDGQAIDYHGGFEGKQYEKDQQIYHYGGRVYDPEMGLFLTPDPVIPDPNNPLAYNRYVYGLGDPLMALDPTGLLFGWLSDVGDWIADNFIEILAVVVIAVVIVAAIVFPPLAPMAIAGLAAGGLIGGYTAAVNGTNIVSGILVGAALGGLGGLAAGAAVGALGLASATSLLGLVAKGAISGAISGAFMGVATAYASGATTFEQYLTSALIGAGVGALTGALWGVADFYIAGMKSPIPTDAKGWEKFAAKGAKKAGEKGAEGLLGFIGENAAKVAVKYLHPYIIQPAAAYVVAPMLTSSFVLVHPEYVSQFIADRLDEGVYVEVGGEF